MATSLLSLAEREYIVGGVEEDLRAGGRTCRDYRYFSLQTGVVSNTSGSAKIQLERTSAIIGVKAELGTPDPVRPNCGKIKFFVDCSALANPEFERREGEELGHHLAYRLSEAYQNDAALDLSSLCVIPGQQCWILYVDALVLEWSGSVLDALSIAVKAALHTTLIPKLTVSGEGEEMEIEISDDPHDSTAVDASNAPVIITLSQVGSKFVVDATLEEECCSTSRLSLAINRAGQIVSMNKEGPGGIPIGKLNEVVAMGLDVAQPVLDRVDTILLSSSTSTAMDLDTTTHTLFN